MDITHPRVAHIVSHTHWDREWYLPYHEFRVMLVRVVEKVLEALESDPDFRHFVLDGQSLAVEDHVEVRSQDWNRISEQVARGRLSLGPWYVLPDEFLVSGEALVRNLYQGHLLARELGGVQKVGYLPDSFGHVAQMPQILARAGIDSFLYQRGNADEIVELGDEWTWRAPDGSEVLAIHLRDGYCNAGGLGYEELWHAHTIREVDTDRAVAKVAELFAKMAQTSNGDVWLLNNGCDHFPPQPGFGEILAALRCAFPETEFKHASFTDHVGAVREGGFAKESYAGELRGGRLQLILSGVWSARMYLKQWNERAQSLLERYVEPFLAVCHPMHHPYGFPAGELEYAWRLLLRNHPHDSICGCSTDEVHDEMVPRFRGVVETGERLLKRGLDEIAPSFGSIAEWDRTTTIAAFNPLPVARDEVITRTVVLQPPHGDLENLTIVDEDGRPLPCQVLSEGYLERFWGIDYRTELHQAEIEHKVRNYVAHFGDRIVRDEEHRDEGDCFLTVRFLARGFPALCHRTFTLVEGPRKTDQGVEAIGNTLMNDLVRVTLHPDGSFDLIDFRSGPDYPGLNCFADLGDRGDEYDFCPVGEPLRADPAEGTVRIVDPGGLAGALEAKFVLHLPAALTPDRADRSATTVACPVRVRVSLTTGSPVVDVQTIFENAAEDHRLSVEFKTPIETESVWSDGHFFVNERPIATPAGKDWVQPPPETIPQQEFSLLSDGERGLAVLNRGLPEAAARRESGGATLSLTLLRAVGWLSRDDFPSRHRQNAGPTIHTPEAQCPGEHTFHYAVLPFAGGWLEADVPGESLLWRTPSLTKQGAGQYVPGPEAFFTKTEPAVRITALKRLEDGETLIVRMVNLSAKPVTETLMFSVGGPYPRRAWRTDLLEERLEELQVEEGEDLEIPLGPHEIATLELDLL